MRLRQHINVILIFALALWSSASIALEYRAIQPSKAVLYDAPSTEARKLFAIGQGYPVEVIVNLGQWVKVRDNQGGLSWIELKDLSVKRTLLVVSPQAEIRQAADVSSPLVCKVDKDVVLDYVEPPKNGWVKVHHRDGLSGYVQVTSLWGL